MIEVKCPHCEFTQYIFTEDLLQNCPKCKNDFLPIGLTIYTDGAYSSLRNQGGIAYVIYMCDKEVYSYSQTYIHTTSQRMELLAAISALESLTESTRVKIISDSQYLVKTMNDSWKRNANKDLWKRLDEVIKKQDKVYFEWTKGHANCIGNQKADYLSNKCSTI